MKGCRNFVTAIEEREDSLSESEEKSQREDIICEKIKSTGKMISTQFFDYNYDEIREKKLKLLRIDLDHVKNDRPEKKIAQMIQEHWDKKDYKPINGDAEINSTTKVYEKLNGHVLKILNSDIHDESINEEQEIALKEEKDDEEENNFEYLNALGTYSNEFENLILTMNSMKNEIDQLKSLLKKKRKNVRNISPLVNGKIENEDEIFFNDYDMFLLNFYNESRINQTSHDCINDDMKSLNFKQNTLNNKSYLYLYEKMKKVVLGDPAEVKIKFQNSKLSNKIDGINKLEKLILNNSLQNKNSYLSKLGKKIIGLTGEQIFREKKYQIDMLNLPKFSRFFDKLTNEIEYAGPKTRVYMSNLENTYNLENKQKKRQQTLSFIERQNTEALRSIEEKRQKFKHLPKSNKEKMDNNNLHKHWNWIVKKEIPKMYKIYQKYKNDLDYNCKKFSNFAQKEVKKKVSKVQRLQKESNVRGKRLQKEMIVFWRKRDKEILEIKKRKDKYEVEKKKREDEIQEMIIQKKRLEYLMKQSDIYSFFMIRNMGMIDQNLQDEEKKDLENVNHHEKDNNKFNSTVIGNTEVAINPKNNKVIFQSIKVDIDENAAKEGVKQIIKQQREKMLKFDQQTNKIREAVGAESVKLKNFDEFMDEDLNEAERLDKPVINNASSQLIEAPRSFLGELKEYQLKGLRWLDNLYDQGINGILADEMGLGKTIQAIAFLSHLAEEKGNWGPFLIVAPNATLYNWQQELNRFCPTLKVLPYWGGLKERKTLRKFFNSQNLYSKTASFHACVTSYQLVVSDEKVFHRVNWQYMILDEAQAIKNINSQRWNTLLSFNCRNRLLLSGTPIQNSMSELWALLHFIMPNLFDSHEQFQEWFSKDIEAHSQEKGELNQEQLNRLHKILKPFMLRRVKKDVENEIGPKIEYESLCDMTERQKILYNSIKEKLSNISDLFTSVDSKVKVENLMNLVMQFRKVCNHPELFERNLGKVPFIFRELTFCRSSTISAIPNSIAELRIDYVNCIKYNIPRMVYDLCYENILNHIKKYSIFNYNNILDSMSVNHNVSAFNFINLFNFSISEFLNIFRMDTLLAQICLVHYLNEMSCKNNYYKNHSIFYSKDPQTSDATSHIYSKKINIFISSRIYPINQEFNSFYNTRPDVKIERPLIINNLLEVKDSLYRQFNKHRFYIPISISAPVELVCSSSRMKYEMSYKMNNLTLNKIFYGSTFKQCNTREMKSLQHTLVFNQSATNPYIEEMLQKGLLTNLFYKNEGYSQIELPSFDRLIADCAKLKKLDELLERLYKENHRVLIFCQMTRMIDILEEYMAKRRYIYFRMDGSTNIADRRDMVNEFQVNEKIFAFLLSTRAGGLGVNLTGADTVIFYDNDWNPTMDAQATDRAHRIGQTKVVSVYRLITKGTIEERILKRAKQKQNVQTTVYAGGAFKADIFKQSEIVELLYSEEEVRRMEMERKKLMEYNASFAQNVEAAKDQIEMNPHENIAAENNIAIGSSSNTNKKCSTKKSKKDGTPKLDKSKKIKNKNDSVKDENEVSNRNLNSSTTSYGSNILTNNYSQNKGQAARNIFAVSNSTIGQNKVKMSALKVDSSDDENKIIIQDGDNIIEDEEDNDMF